MMWEVQNVFVWLLYFTLGRCGGDSVVLGFSRGTEAGDGHHTLETQTHLQPGWAWTGGSRTQRSESLEQVQALKPRPSRCRDLPEPYLPPYCVTLVLLRPRRLFVPLHGVRKIVSQISRWEAVPSFPGKGSLSPLDRNVATWAFKPHPPSFHLAKRKQRGGVQAEVNAKYPAGSGRLPHLFLPLKAGP